MTGCKTFYFPMFCCGLRLIVMVNRMEHCNTTEEKHTFVCIGLVERVSLYCHVPPPQGLQVTVARGHGWRAPKRVETARWLKPPTYWVS